LSGKQNEIDSPGILVFPEPAHVSSPTDIIQLLGAASVVAGSVLAVFELGERLASQPAKDAVSRWLLSIDVRKARTLPEGTQELFARIFGERHFSLKCLTRSTAFSLGAIVFIGILFFLISPQDVLRDQFWESIPSTFGTRFGTFGDLLVWIPWSILIDYVKSL
jgi:hypothetical protein